MGTYLSDGVVGLGHSFPKVCRLCDSSRSTRDGPALGDGVAIQRRRWRQDVVHGLCCSLSQRYTDTRRVIGILGMCVLYLQAFNVCVTKSHDLHSEYLDSLHQPVAKLQSSRCCGGTKGRCPPLETSNDASILPVLLYRQPEQIPHSMDWTG